MEEHQSYHPHYRLYVEMLKVVGLLVQAMMRSFVLGLFVLESLIRDACELQDNDTVGRNSDAYLGQILFQL